MLLGVRLRVTKAITGGDFGGASNRGAWMSPVGGTCTLLFVTAEMRTAGLVLLLNYPPLDL